MAFYVKWMTLAIFIWLWKHICSLVQFDEYPQATVCNGDNANLIWKYTSNEMISSVQWYKASSPDILMADIFAGSTTAQGVYLGRVTPATALGNAAITLSSVTAADNGTYKCVVNSLNVETRGYLIVAEAPSGLPYFNKTTNSLTCNPPQNEGIPKVQTVLKANGGTILTGLTVQSSGIFICCIAGDAVSCVNSTNNTEICVTETYNSTGPTTEPSRNTTDHFDESDNCKCPALFCVKESGVCILWIIIGVAVLIIIIIIIIIVCRLRKLTC